MDPQDAFAARILMAASAERSLDAQYYIWRGDPVGYLMFQALWQAAQRGVRVRLLLDDINTAGLDDAMAALDAHPNIEIRLYNPMAHRSMRALNLITDFRRANRRMHNKSFTVDHLVTVVGGRNIGDEYYGSGTGAMFIDMDVALVGAAVREVATQFDAYWNSPSAHPAARFVKSKARTFDLEAKFAAIRADPEFAGLRRGRAGAADDRRFARQEARTRMDDVKDDLRRPRQDIGLGINATWSLLLGATFILALSSLAGGASMLPGGLGVTDATVAGMLMLLIDDPSMNRTVAAAATLIIRFATLWFAVLIGAIALALLERFTRQHTGSGMTTVTQET